MTTTVDETHDPALGSWVSAADDHPDFPIQNLPLGIFSSPGGEKRPGIAIGDFVLDLTGIATAGLLDGISGPDIDRPSLNTILGWPAPRRRRLRRRLSALLSTERHRRIIEPLLHPLGEITLHLPAAIGDYTDFFVGIHHARNVGRLLRPDNPLLPNYKYVPIGYHGRASSIRPSGVGVVRPQGQRKSSDAPVPIFGATEKLDYELELGVWIGPGNKLGQPISIDEAPDHIAGYCLLDDWSARDFQTWEYQPLGPFLGKNFHTTISPWVVTAEALAPFRIAQARRPEGDPQPLDHLWSDADQQSGGLSITLEVGLLTDAMRKSGLEPVLLSRTSTSNMYWTVAQMVAHHTSNGCNLNPGDLLGTGTISGKSADAYGSMIEISHGGATPLVLPNGETRAFLHDGDEVIMAATARAEGRRLIGFGPCNAVILPVSNSLLCEKHR
jgi:fumarylacetoacetase